MQPPIRTDDELLALLRQKYSMDATPTVDRFVQRFRERHGAGLVAVVFYGSRLAGTTGGRRGIYDFFLVADGYRGFYHRRRDAWLNRFLAPNTYHLEVEGEHCKYNVVSLEDLRRETSPRAKDLFHAGRLSKRVAVAWTRDVAAREEILRLCLEAMKTVAPLALSRLDGEVPLDRFLRAVIGISYAAEIRVETDSKVGRLIDAERDFYARVYGALLERLAGPAQAGAWHAAADPVLRARTEALLRRSRARMYARWFKYMGTLEGWLDLLLDKIERTKGIRLELTPLQRRYPYIFGWPLFFRFLRQGLVK
jgi:hypothetical protein